MFSRPGEQFGDVGILHVALKMPNLAVAADDSGNFCVAGPDDSRPSVKPSRQLKQLRVG